VPRRRCRLNRIHWNAFVRGFRECALAPVHTASIRKLAATYARISFLGWTTYSIHTQVSGNSQVFARHVL